MSQPSDGSLVSQTQRGETEAFGELVRRYQNSVFNVCYRMLAERRDAEDLTQETFIRAYQRLGSFDKERAFGPWIRRVAANLCLNHIKAQKPATALIDDERDYQYETGEYNLEGKQQRSEEKGDIRAAILELPANYRAAIELRHYQEMSYKEISSQLNLPVSDVKSHLFRARKLLAKRIRSDDH